MRFEHSMLLRLPLGGATMANPGFAPTALRISLPLSWIPMETILSPFTEMINKAFVMPGSGIR
jgi:hypothetical protein